MRFLLLGKGNSIKYIKKYILHNNDEVIHAVFEYEYKNKFYLANEKLLELENIDFAIKSPGISENNQLYLKLSRKFKFISELDLLYIYKIKTKSIVVTGSNGKTTFVSMLKFIFDRINIKSIICGNSFEPITKYYKSFDKVDYLIIEQSSFQLHDLKLYNPYIAIILNMTPNHLDMSFSLNSYYRNKTNIYKYQNKESYFIFDCNNKHINLTNCNANIIELLEYNDKIPTKLYKYKLNINYLYTIFKIISIKCNFVKILSDFKDLKYRNNITQVKGVTFVNDSKSTSLAATLFSLNQYNNKHNIILLLGGKDKKLDYSPLNEYKDVIIICFGELADRIKLKNVIKAQKLINAFNIAVNINLENKVILFSPGSSSFDEFKSYSDRGKYFNKLVDKYKKAKYY